MVVISIKRLFGVFGSILCSFLAFASISIRLFSEEPLDLSFDKQNLLYWGIVVFLFQVLVFLLLFTDQRKLISDLRKITNYKDLNHPHSRKLLNQMGEIGVVLNLMLKDFSSLLELRLSRIAAFNKVIRIICEDYPEPIIITDTMGTILGISSVLAKKNDININQNPQLSLLVPELKLTEVLGFFEKNRVPWKDESGTGLLCTPVYDHTGSLNLCIWEPGSNLFFQKFAAAPVGAISQKTIRSLKGLLKRKTPS